MGEKENAVCDAGDFQERRTYMKLGCECKECIHSLEVVLEEIAAKEGKIFYKKIRRTGEKITYV